MCHLAECTDISSIIMLCEFLITTEKSDNHMIGLCSVNMMLSSFTVSHLRMLVRNQKKNSWCKPCLFRIAGCCHVVNIMLLWKFCDDSCNCRKVPCGRLSWLSVSFFLVLTAHFFRPPSATVVSAEQFSHGTGTLRCLQKEMATYRHWSVSLWRDPDNVWHCRILSPDKTEWRLISATLCGWRCCFVADQLPVMVHDTHTRRRRRRLHAKYTPLCRNVAKRTWLQRCYNKYSLSTIMLLWHSFLIITYQGPKTLQNTAEAADGLQPTAVSPHVSLLKVVHWCCLPVCSKQSHAYVGFSRVSVRNPCDLEYKSWVSKKTTRVLGCPLLKTHDPAVIGFDWVPEHDSCLLLWHSWARQKFQCCDYSSVHSRVC